MSHPPVVSRDAWIAARKEHLAKEKALTRLRDELSEERRRLPWVEVETEYVFEGPRGPETLGELFDGRSQLIVYHFMFDPGWDEGCKSCSFWADNFDGIIVHLNHRDVTMVAVSRAPFPVLDAFRRRMGWRFKWVSSFANGFNRDYHVSFTPEEQDRGPVYHNYAMREFPSPEAPGISVFYRDPAGTIFHAYSCYARGLDMVNGAYHLLDLAPKGRDEAGLEYPMAWVRHHDRCEERPAAGPGRPAGRAGHAARRAPPRR
jgi:predicted dithiol-disulfide oxidoreductase (DUF899 family)